MMCVASEVVVHFWTTKQGLPNPERAIAGRETRHGAGAVETPLRPLTALNGPQRTDGLAREVAAVVHELRGAHCAGCT